MIEENEIKEGVAQAFEKLLSNPKGWCPSLNGVSFVQLEEGDVARLEAPFSEEEVYGTLSELSKDRALGPNGFTLAF